MAFLSNYTKGCLFALAACFLWSCNILFAQKLSEQAAGPVAICLFRWVVASVTLLIFYHKSIRADWVNVPPNWKFLAITGVVGIACLNTFIYYAGHYTTAMNMGLISTIGPLFIFLFSYLLFKDPLGIRKVIGGIIAIIGLLLLISQGKIHQLFHTHFSYGDLFMISAMVCAGIYSALMKKTPQAFQLTSFLFYIFVIGAISLLPFYFITETNYLPHYDATTWVILFFLSWGPSLLAFLSWSKAIALLGPNMVGMLYFSLPALSSFLAIILLGETLEHYHIVSFSVILFGVVYSLIRRKSSKVP